MPAQPTANQTLLFEQCVFELLQSSKVRKMDEYIQHGTTTTLTHSLAVAWYSYRLYLFLGLCGEEKQLIRGALLHDFYLYDWHWPDHGRLHGFFHPAIAAKNAAEAFAITDLGAGDYSKAYVAADHFAALPAGCGHCVPGG
ncbi:MAG: hypothetical protein MSH10_03640 [Pygmaiobacter massiliensis]|nr:hypothetical protein [Pygmaiobacter massiliensis]